MSYMLSCQVDVYNFLQHASAELLCSSSACGSKLKNVILYGKLDAHHMQRDMKQGKPMYSLANTREGIPPLNWPLQSNIIHM